jgi:hypothetical protein
MRSVRAQYDAYNRRFQLMDQEVARDLKDGQMYLIADFFTLDCLPAEDLELLDADQFPS